MARYTTGAWTTQESLMTAVDGVLTTEGWSQNELDVTNDEAGWNVGSLFVQADWDNSADINFYQSTAWDGAGTAPGAHTGDSGSDHTVNAIGNSGVAYHAFTNNSAGVEFAYFVIEYDANFYRHFGFFNIEKHGGWTGGEGVYGHLWDQGGGPIDEPNAGSHSVLFDGGYSTNSGPSGATMRCAADLPNKPASSVWGVSHFGATIGNDTGGNGRYRLRGGYRRGPFCQAFGFMDPVATDAFVPGAPIPIISVDPTHTAPEHWMWMGEMPLIYAGSISGFTDEQVVTFGSEDWMVFPLINSTWSAGSGLEQSGNAGIWYRRT